MQTFISSFFSSKRELQLVSYVFLSILLIPVIAVILLINVGIDIVSDKIVTYNTKTKIVDIHNPDGSTTPIKKLTEWPTNGVITLEFGQPDLPYQPFHTGIDIANAQGKSGDPIVPFMDGVVTYAGEIFWGFGKYIVIDSKNNITSIYAHLSKIYVYPGEEVKLGQVIGREGQTGWATGPHLHFQVNIFQIPVNPRIFLGDKDPS